MTMEKQQIEKATAHAFLALYNRENKTSYKVTDFLDAPDVRCEDLNGNKLNLEITLTEDRPKDIAAALGRSDHKSIEAQRANLDKVRRGKSSILEQVSCLSGNVLETLAQRINAKLHKDYGSNVALVVRDASPVGWDWESVLPDIQRRFEGVHLPFQEGVWLVTYDVSQKYRLL